MWQGFVRFPALASVLAEWLGISVVHKHEMNHASELGICHEMCRRREWRSRAAIDGCGS
jgi:hypothetical protein